MEDEPTIELVYVGPSGCHQEPSEGIVVSGSTVTVTWMDFMLDAPRPANPE